MRFDLLEGQFINLRRLNEEDAKITLAWRLSQRARFLNKGAQTLDQQAKWIRNRPASELNYVIELKSGLPVGMLSLINIDQENRNAESSRFLIGDEEAVKGIPAAIEAMKLLYELAFDKLKLSRIYGTIASNNKLMIKWQKYLGMKEEGCLRNHYFSHGNWHDGICLGLLEKEYRNVSLSRMNILIKSSNKK